ncbi:GntR family transcriptional regulator [Pseudosulfitobacter sp. DSM 107133]|uniref:GntR family transcriptional regulator n=1 Tax=Pseudosulfitobacter sp. DSM 107133 TaxID=2883100 RepID=UPI000DF3D251|nr:GntR family transcriptional regulator [Pseudosulfitobacter sp. DSM 107133]UOA29128.1 HTH-type transcriptional repressor RspR [Pseudosulfitobacter sp. DSM 107133]
MQADRYRAVTLDVSAPIAPQIYAHLRDAIIRNQFTAGERISESEIAKSCDVSRQPVREAFIRLAGEGLLAILPQRGTVITKINYTDVLNARFLREAIEADIVAILATTPDAALIRELRAQLAAQKAVARNKPTDFIELDERFHRTLADAAGKRGAWRRIEGLKSQMDRVRFLSLGQFPAEKLVAQHAAIVDSIEGGDMPAANAAIRGHLREVLSDLPRILAANPDFFELPDGEIPMPVNAPILGGDTQ